MLVLKTPRSLSVTRQKIKGLALLCTGMLCFCSCYTVRILNRDAVPEPDPLNRSEDFYRGKLVHTIDTTVSLKLYEGEFSLIEKACRGCGFYSFEYRPTFGGVLLNAVTFGSKRRIKAKYVCVK